VLVERRSGSSPRRCAQLLAEDARGLAGLEQRRTGLAFWQPEIDAQTRAARSAKKATRSTLKSGATARKRSARSESSGRSAATAESARSPRHTKRQTEIRRRPSLTSTLAESFAADVSRGRAVRPSRGRAEGARCRVDELAEPSAENALARVANQKFDIVQARHAPRCRGSGSGAPGNTPSSPEQRAKASSAGHEPATAQRGKRS